MSLPTLILCPSPGLWFLLTRTVTNMGPASFWLSAPSDIRWAGSCSACHRATEETNPSHVENNPSWLLPLVPSRATGALSAVLYLHPDRDYALAEAGQAALLCYAGVWRSGLGVRPAF